MEKQKEYTDEELIAEIDEIMKNPEKISEDEAELDAYFNDPANAKEIDEMFARMKLVEAMTSPEVPNQETIAAMEEAKRIAKDPNIKGFRNEQELLHELES